jgi:hypothetical protein
MYDCASADRYGGGALDVVIAMAIRSSIARERVGHEINSQGFGLPPRPMYSIGGRRKAQSEFETLPVDHEARHSLEEFPKDLLCL